MTQDLKTIRDATPTLLACPFCGHDGDLIGVSVKGSELQPVRYVSCSNCGTEGPASDDADGVDLWQRRTTRLEALNAPQTRGEPLTIFGLPVAVDLTMEPGTAKIVQGLREVYLEGLDGCEKIVVAPDMAASPKPEPQDLAEALATMPTNRDIGHIVNWFHAWGKTVRTALSGITQKAQQPGEVALRDLDALILEMQKTRHMTFAGRLLDIRAALTNAQSAAQSGMTLPELPEGWIFDELKHCAMPPERRIDGLVWGFKSVAHSKGTEITGYGQTPRDACLAAIAKITQSAQGGGGAS